MYRRVNGMSENDIQQHVTEIRCWNKQKRQFTEQEVKLDVKINETNC